MNNQTKTIVQATLDELLTLSIRTLELRNHIRVLQNDIDQLARKLEAVLDSEKSPKSGAQ